MSYYRCHINTDFLISISDNNDTSVTFVNVLIVDIEEKYFRNEMKVVLSLKSFFVFYTQNKKYKFLLLIAATYMN